MQKGGNSKGHEWRGSSRPGGIGERDTVSERPPSAARLERTESREEESRRFRPAGARQGLIPEEVSATGSSFAWTWSWDIHTVRIGRSHRSDRTDTGALCCPARARAARRRHDAMGSERLRNSASSACAAKFAGPLILPSSCR
jgi:hypothetical protein